MALSKQINHRHVLLAYLQTAAAHGVSVDEHPSFGGIHPVHVKGSFHYDGLAADMNTASGASAAERAALKPWAYLANELGLSYTLDISGRGVGSAANHRGHLHVDVGSYFNDGNGARKRPAKAAAFMRKGDTGHDVEVLQRVLVLYGFNPGAIDGVFGVKTKAAVEAYQSNRKLKVDGVVGPITWQQIREV